MSPGTKPSRIAVLFEYSTLLGGERSMLACLENLLYRECHIEFVAIGPDEGRLATALTKTGLKIIPWKSDGQASSREQAEEDLISAVQKSQADLLHANSLSMGRLTGRIAPRVSIPTTAHLRDILKLSQAAISDLNQNRRLIAVSHAARDYHVAQGLDPDKVVVVHNGMDLNLYQPRARTGGLHQELRLPPNARLLATIGQIGLRKGQDILAAAAPEIVRRVPDVHFVLIGERSSTKPESIEFEQSILRIFEQHHISGHLHQLGYRDDVLRIMPEIELIVHPANQEPFGRVLLEAAACGIPVVATDVGGTREIVVDGVTGCLVPPRDPKSLANAIVAILESGEQLNSFAVAARDRAVSEFDIVQSAEHLVKQWEGFPLICPDNQN